MSEISKQIASDIDAEIINRKEFPHRWHLGASVIGSSCLRKVQYGFRWMFAEEFDARMLRLFNRGHREEPRFAELLTNIGIKVKLHDADGKQLRFNALGGHFGGSCDGIAELPAKYKVSGDTLLEFKTSGTGTNFNKLGKEKMPKAKPQHWAQICTYGYAFNIKTYLYMAVNKNDDALHIEFGDIKLQHGEEMHVRAETAIYSDALLPRLSDNPTHYECQLCAAKGICHKGETPLKNCRSCRFSRPVDGGEWECTKFNNKIPRSFVPTGCGEWEPFQ